MIVHALHFRFNQRILLCFLREVLYPIRMRPRFNPVFRPAFFLLLPIIFAAAAIAVSAEDWPQWLGPRRDGVWRETGILKEFPTNGLKFRWRATIAAGYSGPSVAEGRVFLTDRQLVP